MSIERLLDSFIVIKTFQQQRSVFNEKVYLFYIVIGGVIMFSACSPVNNGVNIPGESVYATKTEQEYIYEIMLKSDKFYQYTGIRWSSCS